MRIVSLLGGLLTLAACAPEAAGPTPNQRGAALFAPVATALGSSIALDLKTRNPSGFQDYIQQNGFKDEAGFIQNVATEVLSRYGDALSVSAAMEAELKAGKWDDAWNRKKMDKALAALSAKKMSLPQACQYAVKNVQSDAWKGGLPLEFVARMLEAQLTMPAH